jgi:hypothetical protein
MWLRVWRVSAVAVRAAVLASACGSYAAEPAPAPDATPAVLIARLESGDYEARRRAGLRLNSLGGDALPAVEAAIADEDAFGPDARLRLRAALTYLRPRARREGVERERQAWKSGQLRNAYAKFGRSDPASDEAARGAVEAFLALGLDPLDGPPQPRAAALAAFGRAVELGCDDPYVLSLYHLASAEKFGRNEGPVPRGFDDALDGVLGGEYPPVVKLWLVGRYVRATGRREPNLFRHFATLVPAVAKQPELPAPELDRSVWQVYDAIDAAARGGGDLWGGKRGLEAAYAAAAPGTAGALTLRGRLMIDLAWEARGGGGGAGTVTPEGWRVYGERLAEAEAALTAAAKLSPDDARPPSLMIGVKLGQGEAGGGRDAMEAYFRRATELDPDDAAAYSRKLNYLYPRWHGSHAEMVAFGRECLATGNWRAGVPFVLVQAHRAVAAESPDPKRYFEHPDVWADLSAVYEGAVVNFPEDARRRSEYAKVACECGRWDVARAQFAALGDRAAADVFGGRTTLDYYRRKAERLGGPAEPVKP